MSFCVIIEYFRTDLEEDFMVVSKGWVSLDVARRQCQRIKRKLGNRHNVIVGPWRIEDANENAVARCRA